MGGYHPSLCYEEIGADISQIQDKSDPIYQKACPWVDYIVTWRR